MSRGNKKSRGGGKTGSGAGRGPRGSESPVGGSGARAAETGSGCMSGAAECPVRKNAWLIAGAVYAAWLVFLLVLGLRQISG